jgi:hypothetical protein
VSGCVCRPTRQKSLVIAGSMSSHMSESLRVMAERMRVTAGQWGIGFTHIELGGGEVRMKKWIPIYGVLVAVEATLWGLATGNPNWLLNFPLGFVAGSAAGLVALGVMKMWGKVKW